MTYSFMQMSKTSDYSWLIIGYDGWEEIEAFPIQTPQYWKDISNEYAELAQDNKTIQYFEIITELSDAEARLYAGKVLLSQLAERWLVMKKETKKQYINELHGHRFYFNIDKNPKDEFERIMKQFKAAQMRIEMLKGKLEKFETDTDPVDLIDVKIQIQEFLKRDIDLKKMSIKEFCKTLKRITNKQAA